MIRKEIKALEISKENYHLYPGIVLASSEVVLNELQNLFKMLVQRLEEGKFPSIVYGPNSDSFLIFLRQRNLSKAVFDEIEIFQKETGLYIVIEKNEVFLNTDRTDYISFKDIEKTLSVIREKELQISNNEKEVKTE